jgi:Kef-type K+ transport system membrane component KefB
MTLIAALSLLLIGAHLLGRIAERFGQPALLGQMLAGIALGPSLLGWIHADAPLAAVADIAALFVVVSAGLEMRMQHVLESFRGRGAFALIFGFLVPAVAGGVFAYAIDLERVPALVVALCVSVTALPVALRILGSFGMLNTNIARVAISGALLSDVIVLLALGVAMASGQPAEANGMLATLAIAVVKLGVLLTLVGACHFLCSKLSARSSGKRSAAAQPSGDSVLVLTVVFMFALGAVSELLGFHFAIGVFLAALMVTRDLISDLRFESLSRTCELMTASLFGPIFLAYQGIQFEIGALSDAVLVVGLIAVAIVSKLVGGYAAARLQQMTSRDSWGVAIVMNARGVMEMVVASIAFRAGLIDQGLFSALLLMGLVTTVITPWMLKRWLG